MGKPLYSKVFTLMNKEKEIYVFEDLRTFSILIEKLVRVLKKTSNQKG